MSALVQPAKQARSRATQARILGATRELLRSKTFDAISIREIVTLANTSIGSFYGRFRDKHALLPVLFAENESRLARMIDGLKADALSAGSLNELTAIIADHVVDMFGENPNLSRALFEYATRHPESEEARAYSDKRLQQYRFLFDAIARHNEEIGHPDPKRAAELSLYFVTVACRNRLFYPHNPQTRKLGLSKNELKREVTRMMTGYLRA